MRILILTSIAGNNFAYAAGDKVTVDDAEGERLLAGGVAMRLVELPLIVEAIESAAEAANYTVMPSGTAPIPTPSGGYYWQADQLYLVHPSGGRAIIDPLHALRTWAA